MRVLRLFSVIAVSGALLLADEVTTKAKSLVSEKKYDEAVKLLEDSYTKTKSATTKQALADTHVAYGNSYMYNEALPPRQKYPSALKEFRKALEYDKDNKKAQANIKTIEDIYKQMGRPVPQ